MGSSKKAFARMKKNGQTVTGDTLASTLAFNGQCFLLQNMFSISRKSERVLKEELGIDRWIETARDQAGSAGGQAPPGQRSGLQYISPVLSSSKLRAPQTYSTIVKRPEADKLLNLTPDKMAMLVPKFRVFKVEYEAKETADGFLRPDHSKAADVELIFDDFVDADAVDTMFKFRGGRLGGNGVKKFQWSLKGVNPAEVDANITAELTLHFNEVSDIFRDPDTGAPVYKAGSQRKGSARSVATFLDLIVHAPSRIRATTDGQGNFTKGGRLNDVEEPSYMLYEGKFFEIKAEVGWAVPPNATGLFTAQEIDGIAGSQTPLYMQLTKHRFNFNQDGSADLTINYRARYGYREEQFDIIGIDPDGPAQRVAEVEARLQESAAQSGGESNEALEDELHQAEKALDDQLHARYSKILEHLLSGKGKASFGGHLLQARANPVQLRMMAAENEEVYGHEMMRNLTGTEVEDLFGAARMGSLEEERPHRARIGSASRAGQMGGTSAGGMLRHRPAGTRDRPADLLLASQTQTEDFFSSLMAPEGDPGGAHDLMRNRFFADAEVEPYWPSYQGDQEQAASPSELTVRQIARTHAQYDDDAQARGAILNHGEDYTKRQRDYFWDLGSTEGVSTRGAGSMSPQGTLNRLGDESLSATRPSRTSSRKIDVPFFLLGDLIDSVILANKKKADGAPNEGGIAEELTSGRLGLTTLDLEFLNVKLFYQTAGAQPRLESFYRQLRYRELSFSQRDMRRLYLPINIASIPIHFDFFMEWYLRKVVKPKRQKYYFNHFISDLLVDLVMPMLSSRCFYGIPQTQMQMSQLDFVCDKDSNFKKYLFQNGARYQANTGFIDFMATPRNAILPAKVSAKGARSDGQQKMPDVHTNVRVIATTTLGPTYLRGSYEKDMENGIYHFQIGADRGLLKEASFARSDAPYLRESRVNRDTFLGAEQIRELYNVTLRLYGTPLLKPGQFIYVTPAPLGFGSPAGRHSPARFLGIGGYHLVTEVVSTIGRQGYETTVKALHQAMPYLATEDLIPEDLS